MSSDTPLTLREVRQKIDDTLQILVELRVVETNLLQKYLPVSEQVELVLQFNDTTRTVSWFGNSMRLNKKPYLLIKTLWKSLKHRATFDTLEKHVWTRAEFDCVPITTIRSLVNRTNKMLRKNEFPYRIRPIKKNNREISGFFLK